MGERGCACAEPHVWLVQIAMSRAAPSTIRAPWWRCTSASPCFRRRASLLGQIVDEVSVGLPVVIVAHFVAAGSSSSGLRVGGALLCSSQGAALVRFGAGDGPLEPAGGARIPVLSRPAPPAAERLADAPCVRLVLDVEHRAEHGELAPPQRRRGRGDRVGVHLLRAAVRAHVPQERVVASNLSVRRRAAVGGEQPPQRAVPSSGASDARPGLRSFVAPPPPPPPPLPPPARAPARRPAAPRRGGWRGGRRR